MLTRRELLAGAGATSLTTYAPTAKTWFPRGKYAPSGWNTLPLGAGGLVRGMCIAPDGTMVCRSDVGGVYRWSGTTSDVTDPNAKWIPLITFDAFATGTSTSLYTNLGGWEFVIAPSKTSNYYLIMPDTGGTTNSYLYYSTNYGAYFNKTSLKFSGTSADPNGGGSGSSYKIAVDPINENIVYCGVPCSSGNSYGLYQATNGTTFSAVTDIPSPVTSGVGNGTCGICFDTSYTPATSVVGGQTVTSRIIVPVEGVGIYESLDGGVTWSETAVSSGAFTSTSFAVWNGVMSTQGVYYCVAPSSAMGNKIWRYSGAGGTWQDISPISGYGAVATILAIDPRAGHEKYLLATGPNGVGQGYITADATVASPSWVGATSGQQVALRAPSYDIPYLNYIFGQGSSGNPFAYGTAIIIDSNGVCWWCGNQSIWYFTSIPVYGSPCSTTSISFGRGQETTVAQDIICPPGAAYPTMGMQDLGGVLQGTFTSYPTDVFVRYREYVATHLEYAASDPSFVVARITDQGSAYADVSAYNTNYGAMGSWTSITGTPTSLWQQGTFTAGISDGAGSPGLILDVSDHGTTTIYPTGWVQDGTTFLGKILPYGSSGTTGTGGNGTYALNASYGTKYRAPSSTLNQAFSIQGGQTVAVDPDHWVTVPIGIGQWHIPVYTANARANPPTWALTDLPLANWCVRSTWAYGAANRPFAVGYGTDLGTVWAAQYVDTGTAGTISIYKSSTDSWGTFRSPISTVKTLTGLNYMTLYTVPGFPQELWLCTGYPALAHSSDGGAHWDVIHGYNDYGLWNFTLGAPATTGGYPTLYCQFHIKNVGLFIYEGQYVGGTTINWTVFGNTGGRADLPPLS